MKMDFEELQKSWKSQPVNEPHDMAAMREQLTGKWRKQQRGVLRSNLFTTIGFIGVFFMFGKVYGSFHEGRSIMFSGSIMAMTLVMLVYLWVIWKGIALKKMDLSTPADKYLGSYLKTLHWRRKLITTYGWVYCILLWVSLMLYLIDVTHGGSLLLQVSALGGTTLYILIIQTIAYMKGKKNVKKIDELVADITSLKEKMIE